jgi:hypothetical protein
VRKDGKLPIRFAYSFDLARQPMATVSAAAFYESMGSLWQTIESNPWLWMHGMSSEGDWDAPNRGCLGEDLPVKPGVDERQVKEILETCPDFNSATVQALMRGLRSGWRFAGVHGVGSKALRIFVEQLEEQMRRNPGLLTPEYVQDMRNGFAVQSVSAGQRPPLACDRADQHRAALRRAGLRVSRTRKDVDRSGCPGCW